MGAADMPAARTYGNWRRPTTPGIGGLGSLATVLMLVWLIAIIITIATGGFLPAGVVFLVGAMLLGTLAYKDKHHQTGLQRTSARMAHNRGRRRGHGSYRSGPLGVTPWGTHQLPGLAAASKLSEHLDSYGRPFALIEVPSTSDFTVVFGTEPDGASLVDDAQVDSWVANWGGWLANLGDEPGVIAASVTVESAPDSGHRLRAEVEGNLDPNAPVLARTMLEEVLATYPAGSASIRAYVTVTFSGTMRPGEPKLKAPAMAKEIATRLPALGQSLHATGAGAARPLPAQELCEVIRVAYDPASAQLIDEARAAGTPVELAWSDVGPAYTDRDRDAYHHENATSVTWSMSEAPRGIVQANVLARFLAPHRDIARKRVTLLYRPHDSGRAAAIVQADLRAASSRATTKNPSARALADHERARQAAAEEARGAGLVNFGLVATATVIHDQGDDDVRRPSVATAMAAMSSLSSSARIRLRVVRGSQDSAFAAGLPLGVVVPRHLRIPVELREFL